VPSPYQPDLSYRSSVTVGLTKKVRIPLASAQCRNMSNLEFQCTRPVYYLCTDPEFCSEHCMPDLSSDEAPPFVALKSTDNIPIESSWNLFTNYVGLDIKQVIFLGKSLNYFHPGVELHVCVQVLVCSSFANSFQVIFLTGCGPGSSKSAWMNSLNIGTLTKFGPSETNCYHLASRQTTSVTSQSGLV
jgi:hypothetical protein